MKKKYVCSNCEYSTDCKENFQLHCVTHKGVKAHQCDICGNYFMHRADLTRHVSSIHTKGNNITGHIVTKEKLFQCPFCTECITRFSKISSLNLHMRAHKTEKLYQCQFCTISFTNASNRSGHEVNVHLQKSPYV